MKKRYILINGFLLEGIVNKKYTNIHFEKIDRNIFQGKSNEAGLGCFSKDQVEFIEELLSVLPY